ncbi:MAG: AzlD domain-containing protein [Rhodospirillales bacterium]
MTGNTLLHWMNVPWIVIAGMALVTAATRYTGYWLLSRSSLSPRAEDALKAVPASVLTAIIAPTALATGVPESLAAFATVLIIWRLPALAGIVGGVVIVVALRHLSG